MKIHSSYAIHHSVILLCFTILNFQKANSQTGDSLSQGFLQFQLIGGLGVYYIGDLTTSSYYRIGADLSLNHSDQSGGSVEYSDYTTVPPFSTSGSGNTGQPQYTSNSYRISLSALHVQKLFVYKQTFTYCGLGPMVSYSWNRSTSDIPTSYGGTSGITTLTSSGEDIYEFTGKTSAAGPFVMLGVGSLLINRVSVSAEIGFSALYEWSTQSNSRSSISTNASGSSSTENDGNISHLEGWNVSLYAIRIGLIIEV